MSDVNPIRLNAGHLRLLVGYAVQRRDVSRKAVPSCKENCHPEDAQNSFKPASTPTNLLNQSGQERQHKAVPEKISSCICQTKSRPLASIASARLEHLF